MSPPQSLWLTFAPAIFVVTWSSGFVAAKFGLGYIEPMTFLTLRFACVTVLMAAAWLILRPALPQTGAQWAHLAFVGFLLQAVYFGMCYKAFASGLSVATLALILALQPILVALIAPRWHGEHVGWPQWLGLCLGLVGAVVVILARSEIGLPKPIGVTFAVLGLVGITLGSLWEKRFGLGYHPVTANLVGFAVGCLGTAPWMFAFETMQIDWTWQLMASLLWVIIGSSIIAIALLLAMIRAGDVARVSALFFLVPPFAAAFAWLVLDEAMPPLAWLGMIIAGAGVYIATRSGDR